MGQSKTARRSTSASAAKGAFRREGNPIWVVPMAGGSYARVLDPNSPRSRHLRTDSEEFVSAVRDLVAAGVGATARQIMESYGWDTQLAFLDENGVFETVSEEDAA